MVTDSCNIVNYVRTLDKYNRYLLTKEAGKYMEIIDHSKRVGIWDLFQNQNKNDAISAK